jgi:hypothetical protein
MVLLLSVQHFLDICVLSKSLSINLSIIFIYFISQNMNTKESLLILAFSALVRDVFNDLTMGYSILYFYGLMHLFTLLADKTPRLLSIAIVCLCAQWFNQLLSFIILSHNQIIFLRSSFIISILSTTIVAPIFLKILSIIFRTKYQFKAEYIRI